MCGVGDRVNNHNQINILYVAHERKLGGATISLLALVDEMKKRGHKIIVVVPTSNCQLARELKKRQIETISIFFAWWQMPREWNMLIKFFWRALYILEDVQVYFVWKKLKISDIHIVHTNSSVTDFGAKLAKKLGVKHIWHVREFGEADYNLQYMLGKNNTWEYINNNSDKIIFISKSIYEFFAEFVNGQKAEVVYNGISEAYLYERNYLDKKSCITFLISGNLNRNKQQMLVLQAANELIKKNITNFEVLIAGDSSSRRDTQLYEKELKEFININQLSNVSMLGRVEDMCELRKRADVEIVPSSKEAFGRVTIEAMFAGMPVIGSDSGANTELIEDGKTGLLFKCGDYLDLASKMEEFIKEYSKRNIMGQFAYENVKIRFTAKNNADEVERLYFEILGVN